MTHGAPTPSRVVGAARWTFLAYALALAIATHWPQLRVGLGSIPRPDLFIHVGVFAGWAFLFARAAWFGPRFSPANILGAAGIGLAYGAIDEATQAIEIVRRSARWDDLAANILGVGAGIGATLLLGALETPDA